MCVGNSTHFTLFIQRLSLHPNLLSFLMNTEHLDVDYLQSKWLITQFYALFIFQAGVDGVCFSVKHKQTRSQTRILVTNYLCNFLWFKCSTSKVKHLVRNITSFISWTYFHRQLYWKLTNWYVYAHLK